MEVDRSSWKPGLGFPDEKLDRLVREWRFTKRCRSQNRIPRCDFDVESGAEEAHGRACPPSEGLQLRLQVWCRLCLNEFRRWEISWTMKHLWMLWNHMRCGRCGIFLQRFKSGLAVFPTWRSSHWQELEELLSMQQEEVQQPVEVWRSLWWQEDVWKLKQVHLYMGCFYAAYQPYLI